jgi:hypothetical protein
MVPTEMTAELPWWSRGLHKVPGSSPTVSTNIKVIFSVQNVSVFTQTISG